MDLQFKLVIYFIGCQKFDDQNNLGLALGVFFFVEKTFLGGIGSD